MATRRRRSVGRDMGTAAESAFRQAISVITGKTGFAQAAENVRKTVARSRKTSK